MKNQTLKILSLILAVCMLLPMLAACDVGGTPTEEPTIAPTETPTDEPTEALTDEPTEAPTADVVPVDKITLNPSSLTLSIGESKNIEVSITPDNVTDGTVTWSSSNASVAMVDSDGKVIALSEGIVVIMATSGNGKIAACTVTVTMPGDIIPTEAPTHTPTEPAPTEAPTTDPTEPETEPVTEIPTEEPTEAVHSGELIFELTDDSSFYVITGHTGTPVDVVVPNIYNGLRVIEVTAGAFKEKTTLKSIILPNSVETIGASAFQGCTQLKSIELPLSLENLNAYVFEGCTALETVAFNNKLTAIGEHAFENCTSLKHVALGEGMLDIKEFAFASCTSLESVTLNEGLTTISNNAFDYCSSLLSIELPDTVTTVGNMAFRQARALQSIKFSSSLTSIGNAAFQYCSSLTELVLPSNITSLGNSTFSYCYGLKTVSIMGNIVDFGNSTFYECQDIVSIYINSNNSADLGKNNYIFYNAGIAGEGITVTISENGYIPEGLFVPFEEYNYPQIVKIIVEEGATSVEYFKTVNFLPCLVEIDVADTVEYINPTAFHNSPWWEVQPNEPVYIDGVYYACKACIADDPVEENKKEPTCTEKGSYDTVIYCYGCRTELSRETGVLNPLGHTAGAEANCENAQKCTVCGEQLEKPIGHNGGDAVSENRVEPTCTKTGSYESVVYCRVCNKEFSRETVSIDALGHTPGAAATCTTTQKCTICGDTLVAPLGHTAGAAATCTTAQECTVCGDELVAALGHKPGAAATCTTAQECTVCGVELVAATHNYNEENTCTRCADYKDKDVVFTYNSSDDTYSITDYTGSEFEVVIPSTYNGHPVTSIGDSAFEKCSSLSSISVPDGVTRIGDSAFYACDSLTSIVIPGSVTSIGDSAFKKCSSLASISIPDGVTRIGDAAFYYCSSLTNIEIPDSVTSIGDSAFSFCWSLTSIVIPNGVTRIGDAAFYYCSSLTNIEIPDSVTSIGISAFACCSSLTSIVIPDSVAYMGEIAFNDCRNLTIYCYAAEQPYGWNSSWNNSNRPVVWGYLPDE